MMALPAFCLTICFFVLLFHASLIFRWAYYFKEYSLPDNNDKPYVSILLAVRDEENNLSECLESLLRLSYDKNNLEILIGDDSSQDGSLSILRQYEQQYEHIKVFEINQNLGEAKGKANVLAHLAKEAKGEYFLTTDADIEVPVNWVQSLLSGLNDSVGTIIGFTAVKDNLWQNIDWTFALGMLKVLADAGKPVTGMGNNMLITKKAYNAVGGYENIPFSITEDFELFKQVTAKGFKSTQVVSPDILTKSKPERGLLNLLVQRKRWMKGAVQLPKLLVLLLLMNAFYFPTVLVMSIYNPVIAALLFLFKLTLQSIFILNVSNRVGQRLPLGKILLFEFYSMFITLATSLYFLIPTKVKWKGRKY